jgi:hypothetical protein
MSHVHGDPGLECTIAGCRFPDERFLCSEQSPARTYCVLPSQHEDGLHEDERGGRWKRSAAGSTDLAARQRRVADAILLERAAAVFDRRKETDELHPVEVTEMDSLSFKLRWRAGRFREEAGAAPADPQILRVEATEAPH